METEKKHGLMVLSSKVHTIEATKKAMESTLSKTDRLMRETGKKIK